MAGSVKMSKCAACTLEIAAAWQHVSLIIWHAAWGRSAHSPLMALLRKSPGPAPAHGGLQVMDSRRAQAAEDCTHLYPLGLQQPNGISILFRHAERLPP